MSPVLAFRSFARILSEKYTVITIEPFGYGLSDITGMERSSSNIAEEIHECLWQLGVKEYVLGGHSLAGIWMLEYAEKYPDEVLAVLALDNSFPTQNEVLGGEWIDSVIYGGVQFLNGLGFFQSVQFFDKTFVPVGIDGLSRTEQEQRARIALIGMANENVMGELKWFNHATEYLRTLKYPDEIPVFWALSGDNVEYTMDKNGSPVWKDIRYELSQNPHSVVKVYDGSHMIHLEQGEAIYHDFNAFFEGLN